MAYIAVVTGGAGFVGTELCKQLLERGWTVRATVRDACASQRVGHLKRLEAALPGTLQLFEADLLVPGSFDRACQGADYVFHTASPFFIDCADPQGELIAPAVQGTRNVLSSCAKAGQQLRRVVLTSSVAACRGGASALPLPPGQLVDESHWNETSTLHNGEAYWVSKTLAERGAWELAESSGLDLVCILPEFVMGPVLSAAMPDPTSVGFMKAWLEGKASTGACTFAPDVRDVARAHVLAALSASAKGRYIVSDSSSASPATISRILRQRFPEFDLPEGQECATAQSVDNRRVQTELGLQITPLATTLVDMAVTMIALGIAVPRLKTA